MKYDRTKTAKSYYTRGDNDLEQNPLIRIEKVKNNQVIKRFERFTEKIQGKVNTHSTIIYFV